LSVKTDIKSFHL